MRKLSQIFISRLPRSGRCQSLAVLISAMLMVVTSMELFADDRMQDYFSPYEDVVLSEDDLSQLRGGFVTSDGLEINIGIEKIALMNGELQSWLAMDLSQVSQSSANVNSLNDVANVIQSGSGNGISQDLMPLIDSGVLSVIQNTLDGQEIKTLTELNINVSNVNNFNLPNLGRLLDFQVTQSLGDVR